MAASTSKPVVRQAPVASKAKATPKVAKAAPAKAAAKPTAKATAKPAPGQFASRGTRIRVAPDSAPSGVTFDRRNPFPTKGRMHGFFQAFLDGKGVATLDQMESRCFEMSTAVGAGDNPEAIRRDLLNRVKDWRDGKNPERQITCTREGNVYTCTHVKNVPWAEAVGRKRA